MATITTNVDLALERLEQGEVVAIPTETVYGLAADATNETAIKAVFTIKNRPLNHPLIMHVCPDWDLRQWVSHVPEYAQRMMDKFWPGPLTLVFTSRDNALSSLVNGGQDSIAIRAPKHALTQQLLQKLNRPLVAPSANPFGQISPTTAQHVAHSFPEARFLILDGGRCDVGIESSIVQATHPTEYTVLRSGMLDVEILASQCATQQPENAIKPRVSGQLDTHYQPQKPLYYLDDWREVEQLDAELPETTYTLSISAYIPKTQALHHQLPNDARLVAHHLYAALRHADASAADCIVIERPPNQLPWFAIRDKIMKAGQPISELLSTSRG